MPPRFVERDIFINLVPCYRCYKYDHLVKDRKETDTYKACSECASNDHTYKDCRENTKKCLNCNGNHRTLAAKCPTRKAIIKERTKEQRQAERKKITADTSRQTTYAGATAATTNYNGTKSRVTTTFNAETMLSSLPPNAAACIMSAILFAYTQEAREPGSFQKTIDKMYALNNLPKVRFPDQVYATETLGVLTNTNNNVPTMTNGDETEMEQEEGNKRNRETTPTQETVSKTKKLATNNAQREEINEEEYRLPPPIDQHPNHQNQEDLQERRDVTKAKEIRLHRLPEIRLRAREESIGYIPRRSTHNDLVKLMQSNIIKYTYLHQDIFDDQLIKDNILNRTIDLTAYRIQYVSNQAFDRIVNGTRAEQQTARKSSTDPDII